MSKNPRTRDISKEVKKTIEKVAKSPSKFRVTKPTRVTGVRG